MTQKTIGKSIGFGASPTYVVNSVIALAIMAGFKYVVPAADPLTPLGVEVLGIFLGTLYGWLVVGDVVWPSIACLVFLGLSDYTTVTAAFATGFGNNTVLLMLFFFLFTNIISNAGVIEYVAHWIATRKIAYGKPWMLSILLMIAAIVSFFMVSATAACLVMIPLIQSIARLYGFKPGDKWPMLMMVGLVFVGSTSYLILPFKSLPLIVFASYEATTGMSVPVGPFMLIIGISTLFAFAVFLILCKYVFKPNVALISDQTIDLKQKPELDSHQKFVFAYFIIVLLLLIIPNLLDSKLPIVGTLKSIGNVGILAISVVFYVACQFRDGLTINGIFSKNISWNIIFLLTAAMSMSGAFTAEKTGISPWLSNLVMPIVQGQSPFVFIVLVCLICCLLTNVANNQAVCAIFTPIILTIGMALDASLPTLAVCMMAACNVGMITPPASATGALLHGDKEWVPGKSAVLYGFICSVINLINAIFIIYPLGCLLF